MQKVEVTIFENRILWFDSRLPEATEFEEETDSNIDVKFSSNFDYGRLAGNSFFIYIDIGLEVPSYAAMMARSGFTFSVEGPTWNDLFIKELISPMVGIAIISCYKSFKRHCVMHKIELPLTLETNEEVVHTITQEIVDQYHNHRKQDDLLNKALIEQEGLVLAPNENTITLVKITFLVLDQLLYINSSYDLNHNRKQLNNMVPEPRYFTLKASCLNLKQNPITLTMFDSIMLLHCLDCALQMLLGDRADELIASLDQLGVDKKQRTVFFKSGTELFRDFRAMLKSSNATILNLETNYDWNKLMR